MVLDGFIQLTAPGPRLDLREQALIVVAVQLFLEFRPVFVLLIGEGRSRLSRWWRRGLQGTRYTIARFSSATDP